MDGVVEVRVVSGNFSTQVDGVGNNGLDGATNGIEICIVPELVANECP